MRKIGVALFFSIVIVSVVVLCPLLSFNLPYQALAQGEVTVVAKFPLQERYIHLEVYGGDQFSYIPMPAGYVEGVGKRLFFQLQAAAPSKAIGLTPAPLEQLLAYDPEYEHPPIFAVSPSGKALLVSREGGTDLYSLPDKRLLGQVSPKSVYGAAWSPGEKKIAVVYGDGTLWTGSPGGSFRKVAQGVFRQYYKSSIPVSWSRDEEKILVHNNVVELSTGKVSTIPAPAGELFSWFPDGKKILSYGARVESNDQKNKIMVIEVGSWKKTEFPVRGRRPSLSPDGKWILLCTGATAWNNGEVSLMSAEGQQKRKIADGWDPQWLPGSPGKFLFLSRSYSSDPRTGVTLQELLLVGSLPQPSR